MIICYNWPSTLRHILEDASYVAGIAIAIAAFWGLEQLRITRQIARTNARREAIKFAAERCQYLAEHTIPQVAKTITTYARLKLTFLTTKPQWVITNGEIVNHNFNITVQDAEVPAFIGELVNSLNSIEAFAIPFVAGVADDDIGYQETALGFCQQVRDLMPAIWYFRRKDMARFESAVRLFDLWNKRLIASAMAPLMKSMEAVIKEANEGKIKPIGTDG